MTKQFTKKDDQDTSWPAREHPGGTANLTSTRDFSTGKGHLEALSDGGLTIMVLGMKASHGLRSMPSLPSHR